MNHGLNLKNDRQGEKKRNLGFLNLFIVISLRERGGTGSTITATFCVNWKLP